MDARTKRSAFLYVKKEFQHTLDPLVVSWGYESECENQFLAYHEHQGTRDTSAFLTAPAAIKFLEENDWETKSGICKALILKNYQRFCDLLHTKPICPVTSEFLGQMCSIPIHTKNPLELKILLFEKYKIEIPVMQIDEKIFLRISLNAYNSQDDLEVLFQALEDILLTTTLIKF